MDTKIPLHAQYKDAFFRHRNSLNWRVQTIVNGINTVIGFRSVVDVGCAIGDIVQGFEDSGKISWGMEGSEHAKVHAVTDNISFHDFRDKQKFHEWFDLCTCLEVAEHIETEYVSIFISNITTLAPKLLVSIAPPGQLGTNHHTLEPIEWWDNCFSMVGFIRDDSVSDKIKGLWEKDPRHLKPGILAYYMNLHYYEKFCNSGAVGP